MYYTIVDILKYLNSLYPSYTPFSRFHSKFTFNFTQTAKNPISIRQSTQVSHPPHVTRTYDADLNIGPPLI